jgi:hypothetical protein
MICNVNLTHTSQCPIITSYEVEIRALGTYEGVSGFPASVAGTILATFMTNNGASVFNPNNITLVDVASAFSGNLPIPQVDDTLLPEDVEVCYRVTDSCGTSTYSCSSIIADVTLLPFILAAKSAGNDANFDITLGGNLLRGGVNEALLAGDLLHITIPEIAVDVDLIVGQDAKLPTGYTNDVGNRWATHVVPAILTPTVNLAPLSLFTNSIVFTFNKATISRSTGIWGDGSVGGLTGLVWNWGNQINRGILSSVTVTDDVIKMWASANFNVGPNANPGNSCLTGWGFGLGSNLFGSFYTTAEFAPFTDAVHTVGSTEVSFNGNPYQIATNEINCPGPIFVRDIYHALVFSATPGYVAPYPKTVNVRWYLNGTSPYPANITIPAHAFDYFIAAPNPATVGINVSFFLGWYTATDSCGSIVILGTTPGVVTNYYIGNSPLVVPAPIPANLFWVDNNPVSNPFVIAPTGYCFSTEGHYYIYSETRDATSAIIEYNNLYINVMSY